jgi:hypothetical protein
MRFRTWPVVAIALLGLLALIVASILAAQRKADAAYAQLDSMNGRYLEVEGRLRRVRTDLHLSGILVRDYLLDDHAPPGEYRSQLIALRTESARLIAELRPLVGESDPSRFDALARARTCRCSTAPPTKIATTSCDAKSFRDAMR